MGLIRPDERDLDGDESVISPRQSQESLLASRRGTDETKRIETDDTGNLHVSVSASSVTSSPLASGAQTGVLNGVLTTITTYTAVAAVSVSRIGCSGTVYAKFQLFKNASLVETKRSGPDRSVDFLFPSPLGLVAADVIDVKVTHYYTPDTGDFEATIYG